MRHQSVSITNIRYDGPRHIAFECNGTTCRFLERDDHPILVGVEGAADWIAAHYHDLIVLFGIHSLDREPLNV